MDSTDSPMIDLYSWDTPNGQKIVICLEEMGLPYRIIPVNIRAGDQAARAYSTAVAARQSFPTDSCRRQTAVRRARQRRQPSATHRGLWRAANGVNWL